jgi:hypothetical protein
MSIKLYILKKLRRRPCDMKFDEKHFVNILTCISILMKEKKGKISKF